MLVYASAPFSVSSAHTAAYEDAGHAALQTLAQCDAAQKKANSCSRTVPVNAVVGFCAPQCQQRAHSSVRGRQVRQVPRPAAVAAAGVLACLQESDDLAAGDAAGQGRLQEC